MCRSRKAAALQSAAHDVLVGSFAKGALKRSGEMRRRKMRDLCHIVYEEGCIVRVDLILRAKRAIDAESSRVAISYPWRDVADQRHRHASGHNDSCDDLVGGAPCPEGFRWTMSWASSSYRLFGKSSEPIDIRTPAPVGWNWSATRLTALWPRGFRLDPTWSRTS